jgi:hypothetical protein
MSGVLDRMVMRTRGVLPAVQPLAAPRFAPAADRLAETYEEREAPARPPQAAQKQRRMELTQPGTTPPSFENHAQKIPVKEQQHPIARIDAEGEQQERVVRAAINEGAINDDEPVRAAIRASMLEYRKSVIDENSATSANRATAQPSEPSMEKAVAARKDTADAGQLGAPSEQHTEIHISIGSIELRAPQPEARPRTAPFRPQVTLDEFLRRKPEAGA